MHYLNGSFVSEEELLISPRDLGYSRGYGVFEYLITYNGRPFLINEHLERLYASASDIALTLPWKKSELSALVYETLSKNVSGEEKSIKITVSGGVSSSLRMEQEPTLIIMIDPRPEYSLDRYEQGIEVHTVLHTRYSPSTKTLNYIEAVKQMQIRKGTGTVEPLYYNEQQVFEGARSNIFARFGDQLLSPKQNVLSGITRNCFLSFFNMEGITTQLADFSLDMLRTADEVFFTGTPIEILPITKIDGLPVGKGGVGEVTKEAMRQFKNFTRSHA